MIFPEQNPSMDWILNNIQALRDEERQKEIDLRTDLSNFYAGVQDLPKYLEDYGFKNKEALPLMYINIFKKVIDKISLVYKYAPDRTFEGEEESSYQKWIDVNPNYNLWIAEAERYKNILGSVLKRPVYSKLQKRWRFYVDTIYVPHFAEGDPYTPIAYSIPIKHETISTEKAKIEKDWWMYWSDTKYFWYTSGSSAEDKWYDPDFAPEGEHNLGIMPIVESRTNFPVDDYWTGGASDLMKANQSININLNNLNYATHFQAFNYIWSNAGLGDEAAKALKIGTDDVLDLPEGTTLNALNMNPKMLEMIAAIKFQMQAISQMYNISMDFEMSGDPSSGFALLVKNIDLMEAREDDVKLAKLEEQQVYKVIQVQQEALKIQEPRLPKDKKLIINFAEIDFPINQKEELERLDWDLAHNLTTEIDILQSKEGLTEDEAKIRWEKNKEVNAKYSPAQKAFNTELNKILEPTNGEDV